VLLDLETFGGQLVNAAGATLDVVGLTALATEEVVVVAPIGRLLTNVVGPQLDGPCQPQIPQPAKRSAHRGQAEPRRAIDRQFPNVLRPQRAVGFSHHVDDGALLSGGLACHVTDAPGGKGFEFRPGYAHDKSLSSNVKAGSTYAQF